MPEHLMLLRQFFYPRRSLLFMSLTLDLLASISTIALPVMASQAFAILLGFNSMRWRWMSDAAAAKDFSVILIATASVLLAKTSLEYLRMRLHGRIGEDWSFWLRNRIFQHQLTIDLQYYEDKGIGRYLLRYSGDLGSAQQFVTRGILQFAADLTLLILGIVVIFLLNPYLGGVVGMSLLVWLFVVSGINHMAGKSETVKQNNKSELLAFVNLRLLNMASVKFLNRETGEIRQFERKSEHIRQSGLQYAHWKALAASINTFGVYAIFLLVLWVISMQQHTNPEILSANTFAVMMLLLSLRSLFGRAFQVGLIWKKGGISLKKIAGLLSLPAEPGRTPVEKMTVPVGPLVFREVSHCMAGQQIFNNLSFTLLPGSTGLLHGTTGTGKTVLTKLIAGLYPLQTGDIRLGDQHITDIHSKDLRRSIAVVSGAAPLYGKTVLDAIANSRKPENREKAKLALAQWQLLFPILKGIMPHTRLREGTPQLTSAQATLLQNLRAHLTKKPFLILDEPFQGLDETSQMKLLKLMQSGKPKKGILFLSALPPAFLLEKLPVDWVKKLDEPV